MATDRDKAKSAPLYRLVVFDAVDDPAAVRDVFCKVTDLHPTDAMLWVKKTPGVWPKPLTADQARDLLDGLFILGIAAEARRVEGFPELAPARTIHDAACLPEGFRVKGLRGEPTHWVPWPTIELIAAGRIDVEDEFRASSAPRFPSAVASAIRAFTLRNPHPFERKTRAQRIPRDPVGEVLIVRKNPRVTFRVVENQMNYSYLGERLGTSAALNFPLLVADLVARSDEAYLTPSTRAFLGRDGVDPAESRFPSSQALLEYATHRLLWSWYIRARDAARDRPFLDETRTDDDE